MKHFRKQHAAGRATFEPEWRITLTGPDPFDVGVTRAELIELRSAAPSGAPSPYLPVLVRPPPEACFDQDLIAPPAAKALALRRVSSRPSSAGGRLSVGWLQWLLSVALGVALGVAVVGAAARR